MKNLLFEFYANLRKHIFTGIMTLIPLGITYYFVRFMVLAIYDFFRPIVGKPLGMQKDEYEIVGMILSFLLAAGIVYLVGLVSKHYLFRKGLHLGEKIVARIPLVKFFYLTSKQVVEVLTTPRGLSFRKVVLTEFPKENVFSIAYVTGESVLGDGKVRLVHLFMPSTPNPTTGFLMFVPPDQLLETNITVEESFRIIMSGGLLKLGKKVEIYPYKWMGESSESVGSGKLSDAIVQPASPPEPMKSALPNG